MHICHVITRLIIGGAQENTILSCEGLARRGHRVTLISGPTHGAEGALVERAMRGGYEFIEVRELVRQVNPWLDARAQRMLQIELARRRPDVVHTHSSKAGILGRFAAHKARVPLIVHTVHGMSFNRTQPGLVRAAYAFLERRAGNVSDAIVTVADAMTEQMSAARICLPQRMRTIRSGIETAHFDPADFDRAAIRAAWGVRDDEVVIGTVARLFRKKGYEQLIPMMKRVADRNPYVRFVWVGDGAQRDEYLAQLAALGLRERTTLTGLLPPERVPEALAGFDVLAHASQWEGLPRAAVQALLMEVPVVAFDIDGTPEVVRDGQTGRLARFGDDAAFAEALLSLAADARERQRMGAAGRTLCLDEFDAGRMVDRLEALYIELRAKRNSQTT